uniref:Uncharacterized protein n=1 Tax=Bostrychia tenella TaxID=324755 RepID=A0A1Z1M588_9FLOR|nr:hypothetical protein [Bostrychia tenella]ARW61228.1 hypothetical protein [Bostrychia tenella]
MINSLDSFFEDFQGKWLFQKDIYFLRSKRHKIYNDINKVFIKHNNLVLLNKLNSFYSYNFDSFIKDFSKNIDFVYVKYNKINTSQKFKTNIKFKFISDNLLKIVCTVDIKNLLYEEYIYSISKNLKISIGILKELNYSKYISTVITSYIKLQ